MSGRASTNPYAVPLSALEADARVTYDDWVTGRGDSPPPDAVPEERRLQLETLRLAADA